MATALHKSILLVEDDPLDADLTTRELKKIPLESRIIWKEDGDEAVNLLRSEEGAAVSVVILDLNMPGKGGISVLQEIRRFDRTKNLPVVILSSSKEDSDIRGCYELGANAFVNKATDLDEFSRSIQGLGNFWANINIPLQQKMA